MKREQKKAHYFLALDAALLADIDWLLRPGLLPALPAIPIILGPPVTPTPPRPVLPALARPVVCAAVRGGVTGRPVFMPPYLYLAFFSLGFRI